MGQREAERKKGERVREGERGEGESGREEEKVRGREGERESRSKNVLVCEIRWNVFHIGVREAKRRCCLIKKRSSKFVPS